MATPHAAGTVGPIGQIALTVSNLERSVAFYRDAVGIPLLFQAPPGLAFFDCGGVRLMLSLPEEDFTPGHSSVIYFKASGIEQTHKDLASREVSFIDEPHVITRQPTYELWMCFFRDPDGHVMALMEEKKL